jgi:signal peptidase I
MTAIDRPTFWNLPSPMSNLDKPNAYNPQVRDENPWIEGLKTIGLSAILAVGIRQFVAEARYIPSESMLPTLKVNDRLIIDKVSYHLNKPQRGDIVVFNPTKALEEQKFHDAFIKRVIGLPGDRVAVRGGRVFINEQPLRENYIQERPQYELETVTVPNDSYMVLGDNRNNSYDSHYWGFVPKEKIIGRAVVRFWPFDRLGGIEGDSAQAPELPELKSPASPTVSPAGPSPESKLESNAEPKPDNMPSVEVAPSVQPSGSPETPSSPTP